MSTLILVVFVALIGEIRASEGFCEDYLDCMQRLEAKQNDCLLTERNVQMSSSDTCTRRKWDVKMALNGLHLRRAELARDCVQKNIKDATISEFTLSADQLQTCRSIHAKFPFAPGNKRRKRSSATSKGSKKNDSRKKALLCRKDTKLWHKQCSELAKCCPLTEDCKINTKEIMEQIYEERRKLRDLNENCH
ncbi:hypothetical protein Y032_0134g1812 [Ancylostoma ceylanicum]|uniref:Cysteine rich repeat-containing domain protein n=1 Tax=Ancylostoma ceylanicum TaxID=53326 RepID=A0A016T5S1_9BILA|nr:hypothetical protein Y032_0134g1812 [Ancylostoma ceylanicum]